MPKRVIQLSDVQVKNARPRKKDYKLSDGRGLYLLVVSEGRQILAFPIPDSREAQENQLRPIS